MRSLNRSIASVMGAFILLWSDAAVALPIREFRKFSANDQSTYIVAAVSMVIYNHAANGETAKARCIQDWYFGVRGAETPGPMAIRLELVAAESLDSAKYHIEGVILGVIDKACSLPPKAKPYP